MSAYYVTKLVDLLTTKLQAAGWDVHRAPADADKLIVEITYQNANNKDTVIVGDDTDLLILCLSQEFTKSHRVFVRAEPKTKQKKPPICWDISKLQQFLGQAVFLIEPVTP